MRLTQIFLPLAAASLVAMPLPAFAQVAGDYEDAADYDDAEYAEPEIDPADLESLSATLSDPETQAKLAVMMRALTGMMMDMKVAPIARAAAEMAGEDTEAIDPDTTLREYAGEEAEDMPDRVQEELPAMLERMAGMTGLFENMIPLLREMAAGMGETITESVD